MPVLGDVKLKVWISISQYEYVLELSFWGQASGTWYKFFAAIGLAGWLSPSIFTFQNNKGLLPKLTRF